MQLVVFAELLPECQLSRSEVCLPVLQLILPLVQFEPLGLQLLGRQRRQVGGQRVAGDVVGLGRGSGGLQKGTFLVAAGAFVAIDSDSHAGPAVPCLGVDADRPSVKGDPYLVTHLVDVVGVRIKHCLDGSYVEGVVVRHPVLECRPGVVGMLYRYVGHPRLLTRIGLCDDALDGLDSREGDLNERLLVSVGGAPGAALVAEPCARDEVFGVEWVQLLCASTRFDFDGL
mmetsp:Transcript_41992/g.104859  ORF Transcript_41992/g.104859 Transcript_41992/m.104859 type:complete len:229 (+) Transcript_41992:939-1625(+)